MLKNLLQKIERLKGEDNDEKAICNDFCSHDGYRNGTG
jgi:hypothetical protein